MADVKVLILNTDNSNRDATEAELTKLANDGYRVVAMSVIWNWPSLHAFTLQKD